MHQPAAAINTTHVIPIRFNNNNSNMDLILSVGALCRRWTLLIDFAQVCMRLEKRQQLRARSIPRPLQLPSWEGHVRGTQTQHVLQAILASPAHSVVIDAHRWDDEDPKSDRRCDHHEDNIQVVDCKERERKSDKVHIGRREVKYEYGCIWWIKWTLSGTLVTSVDILCYRVHERVNNPSWVQYSNPSFVKFVK